MRVAIHQPNYAPWCGYFAKLAAADLFILLDDVQMPLGRSFVSRTRIQGPAGPRWLSVPVARHSHQSILKVRFAQTGSWPRKHLGALRASYARTPYFREVWDRLEPLYEAPGHSLALFNQRLIETVARYLGLGQPIIRASDLNVLGHAGERLIALVLAVGGDVYLSGPGGVRYQNPAHFTAAGVRLEVKAYEPVAFEWGSSELSILHALFHLGPASRQLLTYKTQ